MRRIIFEFPDGFQPNAVWLNYVMQSENSGEIMIGIRSLDTKEIRALRDGAAMIEIDRKEGENAAD
nr:MAG TPA: hypothetical protein [Caudoviricetes sp.]DAM92532.1 MAG TPA: hypothetical protein [Caudoviricetes sp.]